MTNILTRTMVVGALFCVAGSTLPVEAKCHHKTTTRTIVREVYTPVTTRVVSSPVILQRTISRPVVTRRVISRPVVLEERVVIKRSRGIIPKIYTTLFGG